MSLRETIETIRSHPTPPNEETAKVQILVPILRDLGWDPFGPEVRWEYSVGETKSGGRVDIALTADGRTRALIEAKAPGSNLDNHVKQVLGYAFEDGVDICVLSDGLQWRLYLPREKGPPRERVFADLSIDEDPVDRLDDDLNTFLGREQLLTGHAETRAKQVRRARLDAARLEQEMPRIWQRLVDDADEQLVELVTQRVYDEVSLRPQREQVIALMRGIPIPTPRSSSPAPAPAEPQEPAPSPPSPTAIMLWGERHPIQLHSDILMTVVEELYKRHANSFDQTVEPLKYQEWQWVSRDRERVASKKPKQTPSGYFVNVHMTAKRQRQRWNRLLKAFGHQESDLQLLYEQGPSEKPPVANRTARPTAVRLWDQLHPVKAHYEVLTTLVEELYRRHGHKFESAATELGSGDYRYTSRDLAQVRSQRVRQTPSGFYVDVNLSAQDVKKRAVRLLKALGHSESDLVYLYG